MSVPAHGTPHTPAAAPASDTPAPSPAVDYADPGPALYGPLAAPTTAQVAQPVYEHRPVDADDYADQADRARAAAAATVQPAPAVEQGPADPHHGDDVRAEVATETGQQDPDVVDQADQAGPPLDDLPDGAVVVPLRGRFGAGVVAILPYDEWPTDANSDMRMGDYESWAEGCLADGHYDEWQRIGPRNRDVSDMFEAYQRLTGSDQGKLSGSMRSYRTSGRRSRRT